MDRRIEIFQYKIQQELILQNDEAQRLKDHLVSLKSEISAAQEKIHLLDNQIQLKQKFKDGFLKRIKSNQDAIISRNMINHHQTLKNLTEIHEKEIEDLQNEFTQTLSKITNEQNNLESDKFFAIQTSIDEAKAKLETIMALTDTVINTKSLYQKIKKEMML